MKNISKAIGIFFVMLFLVSCGSKDKMEIFKEQYDYKVTNILMIGTESYQYQRVYNYNIQIKPKSDMKKNEDFIIKLSIFDGEIDAFSEEIVTRYFQVNKDSNINETIDNIYTDKVLFLSHTLTVVDTLGDDYTKEFNLDTVLVVFDSMGGTPIEDQIIPSGKQVQNPGNPQKNGANFLFWSLSLENPKEFSLYNFVDKDIKLYAIYEGPYTITFDSKGGNTINSQTIAVGNKVEYPGEPVKENARFLYWSLSANGGEIYNFNNVVNRNLTLYAIYEDFLDVTFKYNDNNTQDTATRYVIGYGFTHLPAPQRNGYRFDGWYSDVNLKNKVVVNQTLVTKDRTILYAKWEVIDYDITYTLDNDVINPNEDIKYNINTNTITLNDPSRTGYKFIGWFDNKELNGDSLTSIDKGSFGDLNLFASWEANVYSVTLIFNDDISPNMTLNVTFAEKYLDLPKPTQSGYMFEGWYKDQDSYHSLVSLQNGEINYFIDNVVNTADDHYLYAKWVEGTENLVLELKSNSWIVNGYNGDSNIIVIPEEIASIPVTSIGSYAFNGMDKITEVIVPNTVEEIGRNAFYNCSAIEKITLPFVGANRNEYSGSETYFSYIFGGSQNNVELYYNEYLFIPKSLTEVKITDAKSIQSNAFAGASLIKKLELNEGISSIASYAFNDMTALVNLIIPTSVTYIGAQSWRWDLTVYTDLTSKPTNWSADWNSSNRQVYWNGQWHYNEQGIPTPNS